MNSTRTCLRCDWQGATEEPKCPNCAAPLYELEKSPSEGAGGAVRGHPEERSREAASTAIVAPSATPPRPSSPPPRAQEPEGAAEPTSTRSRSLVALVLTVIVLAFVVGSWLNAHTEPAAETAQQIRPTGLTGTLVYAVPDGAHRSRLWRWDLATGRAIRGPRVPRVIELVDAQGANAGWVGVTSELADGRLQASVLRFLGPDDRATPILEGDLVSWGPQGASVIAGRRGHLRAGCHRSVSIVWAKLAPALRERMFADPALCGDLLSIGQDNASTMFTLERGGRIGIFAVEIGGIDRVLPGYAMIATSGLSDIIVVPQESLGTLRPLAARPDQEHADLRGAALQFLGSGLPGPLPYGADGESFAIARMLAWNANGASALVVGLQGDRRGFYLLDTAPSNGIVPPRYIGPVSGIPYGTFTLDGTVIVETTDGLFSAVVEGELVRLPPPADAPPPEGPIVWIR